MYVIGLTAVLLGVCYIVYGMLRGTEPDAIPSVMGLIAAFSGVGCMIYSTEPDDIFNGYILSCVGILFIMVLAPPYSDE